MIQLDSHHTLRQRPRRYPTSVKGLGAAIAVAAMIAVGTGAVLTQQARPAQATAEAGSDRLPAYTQASLPPQSFSVIAEAAMPTVVRVETSRGAEGGPQGRQMPPQMRRFFEDFFGEEALPRQRGGHPDRHGRAPRHRGIGSGFIIDADGLIVTNHHVIAGADQIRVTLHDGEAFEAELVGSDPKTDLALLRVEAGRDLPAAAFADSDAAKIGDWVVAVGNPFGLGGTVTAGVISAFGRDIGAGPYDDFMQIDASINRGNSGGPPFNLAGDVVGVNTAILAPGGGNIGIGFAIPANLAKSVIDDLKDDGTVSRGWLGVRIQPVDEDIAAAIGLEEPGGALVSHVVPESPAASVLQPGDVVRRVDGVEIATPKELSRLIADVEPGAEVTLDILRDGDPVVVSITLGDQATARQARADRKRDLDRSVAEGMGMALADTPQGVRVREVDPRGPAAAKGLRRGDRITAVGDIEVETVRDVREALAQSREAGRDAVLVRVARGPAERFVALPLPQA